ncbi:MAG: butyrate kinase [Candidatus Izemoplasmatales bacterium]|jgi:butyrate kinase
MVYLILVINPGSTSTKVAIFNNNKLIQEQTLKHEIEDLKRFPTIIDQLSFRKQVILDFLTEHRYIPANIDVFVGRGGLLKPLRQSGTYLITDNMIEDLKNCKYGSHASNLGALLANELARPLNRPAYIVNPVSIDEIEDIARVSGFKGIERISMFHVLNQKAIARKHAKSIGKKYEELTLIVAHLGSGFTVGLHHKGRVIDVNNGMGGDGPFSPERTGQLPTYPLIELCFSGKYTEEQVRKMLAGHGGLVSYLGTASGIEIENRIKEGDKEAEFYLKAMAYNVVKEIGSLYFAAKGLIDGVIVTGGFARNQRFIDYMKDYLALIIPIVVYPGEDEMRALAEGALNVLTKKEKIIAYE